MAATDRIVLGAPAVHVLAPQGPRVPAGVRLDVAAFVGIAPRGPARVPVVDHTAAGTDDWRQCLPTRVRARSVAVAVESFDEYRAVFGGHEGPGLLPYAVAAYFEQGGARAYVVRIVHAYGNAADDAKAVARSALAGIAGPPCVVAARSEGAWGNGLQARLAFQAQPLPAQALSPAALRMSPAQPLVAGSLLRLRLAGGQTALRFVDRVRDEGAGDAARTQRVATLEAPAPAAIESVELVSAELWVGENGAGVREHHAGLGLRVDHPRWLATVLCRESQRLWPHPNWAGHRLLPADPLLTGVAHDSPAFTGGKDRYADLKHTDFFDPAFDLAALDDEHVPWSGWHACIGLDDLTQLCLPDLYQPQPLPAQSNVQDPSLAGPEFAPCVKAPLVEVAPNVTALPGLSLDPRDADDRAKIVDLLHSVQEVVDAAGGLIHLFDVPPGLTAYQVLQFRSEFDARSAAAYHPWLAVAPGADARDTLVLVPPSAVAAGIIAARERADGISHGPANVVAQQVVKPALRVSAGEHDRLHVLGINVFVQDVAGVRLTGARTLSLDPRWRQLTVRRLFLLLERTLRREMQWAVFEPHTPALRRELVRLLTLFLRRLYRGGAFAGATEDEAFFVRCDEALNPPYRVDNGQLLAEIGVAPSQPLEYIVVRIQRSGDGTLTLQEVPA